MSENTVFHFYHPFGYELLRRVLRNIDVCAIGHDHRVRILYLNVSDAVMAVFREFPAFRLVRQQPCINLQCSRALYSNEPQRP